ncbi:MAG: FadR family transcriptional regulator [Bacteriovorax sp.]|nr:FadR family transcriptional regulator [Rhizobacter sp.]
MLLQPIEPRRLYRQIADQLRALIDSGECGVGSRLPPERDLAQRLGVSRASVREAVIALEMEGLVEVRMGSGIYVRPVDPAPVDTACETAPETATEIAIEGPLEIIRARAMIESELAAHAARHMKKAQVDALREAVALMQQEVDAGQPPDHGDRLFHTLIAQACENSVLLRIVSELFDERHNPMFARLGSHFETASSWAAAITEHHAVVTAIASQSPEAARLAMSKHLLCSHDRFTASIARTEPPLNADQNPKNTPEPSP